MGELTRAKILSTDDGVIIAIDSTRTIKMTSAAFYQWFGFDPKPGRSLHLSPDEVEAIMQVGTVVVSQRGDT